MSAPAAIPDADLVLSLAARLGRETVVVGIGNPLCGDDAAGCLVARHLRESRGPVGSAQRVVAPGLRIVEAEEVPESFLDLIVRPAPDTVVLVDAVELGEPPGTVALLEVDDVALREASTHRAPLSLLAQYIQAESGAEVLLLAIQPGDREPGLSPTAEVVEASRVLADLLETAAILASLPDAGIGGGAVAALSPSPADPPEVPC